MALNDEVRTDASTSQRSLATGHLLVTMPKLNTNELVTTKVSTVDLETNNRSETKELTGAVNIRNLIIDESEIPPLV